MPMMLLHFISVMFWEHNPGDMYVDIRHFEMSMPLLVTKRLQSEQANT
jgi:hypothetical protein